MDHEKNAMKRASQRKRQAWGLPWFRNFDGFWYVTIKGVKHKLVRGNPTDPDNNRQAALDAWHHLSALDGADANQDENPLWVIFERFLDYAQGNAPEAYPIYRRYLQKFKDSFPALRVSALRSSHMDRWFTLHPSWGPSTQRAAGSAVLAALNWAAKPCRRLLTANPIRGIDLPAPRSRGEEAVIPEEVFRKLVLIAPPDIQDALLFLRLTGTRPCHLARITAAAVDIGGQCVRIDQHKTRKKTGKPLVCPLCDQALTMVQRLALRYPEGALFRNQRGQPLTGRRMTQAFGYLKRQLGLGKSVILYGIRHTFATELFGRMPDAELAFTLGHTNTTMLYKHYGHMEKKCNAVANKLNVLLNEDDETTAVP